MFQLFSSSDQEVLAAGLARRIQAELASDPFQKQTIIVQSDGMANWLKLQLADHIGICSHVEFVMPSNYLWRLYHELIPEIPERSMFSRERLKWVVFQQIKHLPEPDQWGLLTQFVDQANSDAELVALAEQITDIYDHYLMYRHDWLLQWEQGDFQNVPESASNMRWQAELWQLIVKNLAPEQRWHRANIAQRFTDSLKEATSLPQIKLFGLSAIPPTILQQFVALSRHTNVELYWQNLSEGYWGDLNNPNSQRAVIETLKAEERGDPLDEFNPLFASWGQFGRAFLNELIEADIYGSDTEVSVMLDPLHDLGKDTTLGHLQHGIFNNTSAAADASLLEPDDSISFVSAHSPMREVQVLKDAILSRMASDESLEPKDIVILTTKIETYGPLIQGIFDTPTDAYRLPVAISDRAELSEQSIFRAIQSIFELHRSRATVSEVMDLLDSESIRSRFGITLAQLEHIRRWIQESNVHWGFDDEHWQSLGFKANSKHHWDFALDRLATSVLIDTNEGDFDGRVGELPVTGTQLDTLAAFSEFIQTLKAVRVMQHDSHSPAHWRNRCIEMIEKLIDVSHESADGVQLVFKRIESFFDAIDDVQLEESMTFDTLVAPLTETLLTTRNAQRFATGRINVCTFLPMRAIPFKMVCMIGMNDGEMPRITTKQNFDLTQHKLRRGDRQPALEDKYLFLEAVTSAQDHLYMSWISEDLQKGTEKEPSMLVSELLNYLEGQATNPNPSRWVTEHRLHPFNELYFQEGPYQSFDPRFMATAPEPSPVGSPEALAEQYEVDVERFTRFFKNPAQAYLQRFNIFIDTNFEALPDIEPFSIDGLTNWRLVTDVANSILFDEPVETAEAQILHAGGAPSGDSGSYLLNQKLKSANKLFDQLLPFRSPKVELRPISIDLQCGDTTLTISGQIPYRRLGGKPALVDVDTSSSPNLAPKKRLVARLTHLIACASGLNCSHHYVRSKKVQVMEPIEQSVAMDRLSRYAEYFLSGQTQVLAFMPEFIDAKHKYESDDAYFQRAFMDDSYLEAALSITSWVKDDLEDAL